MKHKFFVTKDPPIQLAITTDTIYRILADKSYVVPRKHITAGKFYFCLTTLGSGIIEMDGHKFLLSQGDFILLKPSRHFAYQCKENQWHFWWIEFFCDSPPMQTNQLFSISGRSLVENWLEQAIQFASLGDWGTTAGLCIAAISLASGSNRNRISTASPIFEGAIEYIQENLKHVTVGALCGYLGMNERTLRNHFKRKTGVSTKQYIDLQRFSRATYLLENTDISIEEIAEQLGFTSRFHFGSAFCSRYTVSPSEYRRQVR